jgi:uncharacterized protein (DUF488 family)
VGHGTLAQDELAAFLRGAGVVSLVDVRTGPGSRRNPHLNRAELERWLPEAGIDYRWEKRLGGFRTLPAGSPDRARHVDTALRNDSFRAYAGHMRTPDFGIALAGVLGEAARRRTAVMCSETVWWRCHRRLVADAAQLLRGADVWHLMPGGPARHRPTDGVRVAGDVLVYDAGGTAPLPWGP